MISSWPLQTIFSGILEYLHSQISQPFLPSWAGRKCSVRGLLPACQIYWEGEDSALLTARHGCVLSWEEQCARKIQILLGILSLQPHSHSHWCFQRLYQLFQSWWKLFYPVFQWRREPGAGFPQRNVWESGSWVPHSSSDTPNSGTWVFTHFHKSGSSVSSQFLQTVSVNRHNTMSCLCLEYVSFI